MLPGSTDYSKIDRQIFGPCVLSNELVNAWVNVNSIPIILILKFRLDDVEFLELPGLSFMFFDVGACVLFVHHNYLPRAVMTGMRAVSCVIPIHAPEPHAVIQ